MGSVAKVARLLGSYGRSLFIPTPIQIAIQVTEACDIKCTYCPRDQASGVALSLDDFLIILAKAKELGAGYFNITGGEPLIWEPLIPALSASNQANFPVFLSTNGFSLDDHLADELGSSGLDVLNVSLDGISKSQVSPKTLEAHDSDFTDRLSYLKQRYGVRVSVNGVITNQNVDQVQGLIDYSRDYKFKLSLGLAVPDLASSMTKPVIPKLPKDVREAIHSAFKSGILVEPLDYFINPYANCYESKKTSICIDPNMDINYCYRTKGRTEINIKDLDQRTFTEYLKGFKEHSQICNPFCVANCLYLSAYSRKHPLRTLRVLVGSK